MCYEMALGTLINTSLECGPSSSGTGITHVKDETRDIQDNLVQIIPQLSLDAPIFHPRWVRKNGILYQCNNTYLITGSDGLDPVFSHLDDLMVIGGDMVIFVVSLCNVQYYDSHFHAYVVDVTPQRMLFHTIVDYNIHHGHKLADGKTYISLRYYFLP